MVQGKLQGLALVLGAATFSSGNALQNHVLDPGNV
jgi:hypothetical protein